MNVFAEIEADGERLAEEFIRDWGWPIEDLNLPKMTLECLCEKFSVNVIQKAILNCDKNKDGVKYYLDLSNMKVRAHSEMNGTIFTVCLIELFKNEMDYMKECEGLGAPDASRVSRILRDWADFIDKHALAD